MQEQELFNNYEIKNWEFTGRFYKILAASVVFNILAIAIVGQSNLLTKKGCDSPMVEKVCTVIDALYVGGTLATTDSRSVDEPYTPTEITSEDEIVWVPVDDRLSYPEGYFQVANPDSMIDPATGLPMTYDSAGNSIPGIPDNPTLGGNPTIGGNPTLGGNPTTSGPLSKPQILPKRPKGKVADLSDFDPTANLEENPTVSKDQKDKTDRERVVPTPDPKDPKTADKTPANPDEIVTNRRPLKELVPKVKEKLQQGMAINSPFVVQASGKLTKDGKIDKIKFTKSEGSDPNLLEVVRSSVTAINDSGYLQYLALLNGETLNLQFSQDDANVAAVVQSEMATETRAGSLTTMIRLYLDTSRTDKEKKIKALQEQLASAPANSAEIQKQILDDTDDLALLKYATVTQEGKKLIIRFQVPQEIAKQLIERKLNEPESPEVKKPNSAAQVVTKTQTAGK